jgi:putative glutamine amidotransferase
MRIGITQRVEFVAAYGEHRDCLDQQWFSFIERLGFTPIPIPNALVDIRKWAHALAIEGLILSGGNDLSHLRGARNISKLRDQTEIALLGWAREHNVPVLGVCRGLQMMNFWLGGQLVPVTEHVAVRHGVICTTDALPVFGSVSEVNSFHNWGITPEGLAAELLPQCLSQEGHVEAFWHISLPWAGIMWHPERDLPFNEFDRQLFNQVFRG